MRHTKHLWRAGLILVCFLAFGVLARSAMQPATYGLYGRYRGANVQIQRDKPMVHGAPGACAPCHQDQQAAHDGGVHKTVTCESCHAPLTTHVKDGEVIAEMPIEKDAALCLRCHRKLDARPSGFPQIEVNKHMQDLGMEFTPDVCFACHLPHQPTEGL